MGWYILYCIFVFCGGFVIGFFVMRNNPRYFQLDDILKGKRNTLIGIGKEKLEELKKRIEDALNDL